MNVKIEAGIYICVYMQRDKDTVRRAMYKSWDSQYLISIRFINFTENVSYQEVI